jgi:predicted outer membrane protein
LALIVALGTVGLVGCEQERDLGALLPSASTTDTNQPSAGTTEPSPTTEPTAMGGGPAATASPALTSVVQKADGCVMDDKAKTDAVLGFLHATNRAQMVLAKLAVDRAKSEPVKAFGREILREHDLLDQKLVTLAKKLVIGLEPATTDPILMALSTARDAHLATLVTKTGSEFEAAYVGPEASEHTMVLKVVEQGQKAAKDKDVQALLTEARAMILRHGEHAMKLQDELVAGGGAKAAPKAMGGGPAMPGAADAGRR